MSAGRFLLGCCAAILMAGFAACGGGGDGGGSPPFGSGAPSKIFVGDSARQAIGSSPNSNPVAGASVVERVIMGASTRLSTGLRDFALDAANDRLYVADLRSILVFSNAGRAAGDVAPRVLNSFLGLGGFVGIHLDTVNDRLYAPVNLGAGSNEVRVFNGASAATNAFPSRTFEFDSNFLIDVAVDATRDILYAFHLNATTNLTEIAVFDGASTLSGVEIPNRVITIGSSYSSTEPAGIFIDAAANRLYAPNHGEVRVYDNASTRSGAAVPERVIALPVPGMTSIAVELTSDRLYTVDGGGVNVIPNASTAVGLVMAVRILAPPGSVFEAVAVKP